MPSVYLDGVVHWVDTISHYYTLLDYFIRLKKAKMKICGKDYKDYSKISVMCIKLYHLRDFRRIMFTNLVLNYIDDHGRCIYIGHRHLRKFEIQVYGPMFYQLRDRLSGIPHRLRIDGVDVIIDERKSRYNTHPSIPTSFLPLCPVMTYVQQYHSIIVDSQPTDYRHYTDKYIIRELLSRIRSGYLYGSNIPNTSPLYSSMIEESVLFENDESYSMRRHSI